MSRIIVALALLALPGAAFAQSTARPAAPAVTSSSQQQAESGQPPKRIRDITLAAGQACPKAEDGEVVVCRTLEDPYRIPKPLRDQHPIAPQNQSWSIVPRRWTRSGARPAGCPIPVRRSGRAARRAAPRRCCANGPPSSVPSVAASRSTIRVSLKR